MDGLSTGDPQVLFTAAPASARGIVVVLHGGRERSQAVVRGNQLAVLRMVLIARRIAAAGAGQLVVARVLNRLRGWNGQQMSPVQDARAAVELLRSRFGADLPICLVGHSMGGRTAMRVADEHGVRSVVGLAPWLPPGEPTAQLRGKRVLIVHGRGDRMTSAAGSAAFARSITRQGATVSYVDVPGEGHSMLRRQDAFDGLAAGFAAGTLLLSSAGASVGAVPPADDASPAAARTPTGTPGDLLRRALAGEPWLVA